MALKRVPLDLGAGDARCARQPLTLTSSTTGLVTLGRVATVFRTPGPAGSRPVASVCGDTPPSNPVSGQRRVVSSRQVARPRSKIRTKRHRRCFNNRNAPFGAMTQIVTLWISPAMTLSMAMRIFADMSIQPSVPVRDV